jgi:nitrogen fixation/metabolism regulation signal transduction histidine kinase
VVSVATGRIKRAVVTFALIVGVLVWFAALMLFSPLAQDSEDFSRALPWILLVNLIGIALLMLLIVASVFRLMRDYRRHVPGSRLKARMMMMLVILAVTPLLIVYAFAVQFINRGIDSWFDVDVERGLGDALELSQTALSLQMREHLGDVEGMAQYLAGSDRADIVGELGDLRRDSEATELTIFAANDQILVTSSANPELTLPRAPTDEVTFQLLQGDSYLSLEPQAVGGYEILAAVNLDSDIPGGEPRILQARFEVEQRLSELGDLVQASYNQYAELSYLREALKTNFTVMLTIVLLITLLAAVYGAFFSAKRLVVPIQQLMAGTRAVARGDFDTQLPIPARDEIGFLINSFNDMTQRLARARKQASSSQQQVEEERRKVEVILARLSTGVVSLETDLTIRTANRSAGAILGVNLDAHLGESLVRLAEKEPFLSQFLSVSRSHLDRGDFEWREQIVLRGEVGRRVLMCACTALSGEKDNPGGYIVVFDDITALLQAQRDAAWGEVARRLAHEIKNPLTPIQLSAERLRRRYLGAHYVDSELLDKATHTIIQQVEAMKEMVNAFSEYARTPEMDLSRFDLNKLIAEVAELYRHREQALSLVLELDTMLPNVEADEGRMRQVLHNLIGNALEAIDRQEAGEVRITTRHLHQEGAELAKIAVLDNGPGFLDDIVDQAFDPYVTSKPKGTGLGLAIVKKLIEEHGGQIAARNSERAGAEIVILLPVTREAGDAMLSATHRHDIRRERA